MWLQLLYSVLYALTVNKFLKPVVEWPYYRTLQRLEHTLLSHASIAPITVHTSKMARGEVGPFRDRFCEKPTSATRVEQDRFQTCCRIWYSSFCLLLILEPLLVVRLHETPKI